MRVLLFLIALFIDVTHIAVAQDCNKRCCKTIRITPWDKNTVCDPTCKVTCEAAKSAGVKLPEVFNRNVFDDIEKALHVGCNVGFEAINKVVIVNQAPGSAPGSEQLLVMARDILIRSGAIGAAEFHNVNIRWGFLYEGTRGQAPDRNVVFINQDFLRNNSLFKTTSTLAHEMVHIRQYRQLSTDEFKCRYTKQFVKGFCGQQTHCHELEAEAHRFEDQIRPLIEPFVAQLQPASRCETKEGSCFFPTTHARDAGCACQWPNGATLGEFRNP